ncbi:MAG: hypothetical protein GF353_21265 [Candidatus Lokiarchaeota archaeon]|nr:hypothetical protein [Candidatus Lokiarchaeota archaeon]
MQILILDGQRDADSEAYASYITDLKSALASHGNDIQIISLRNKKIKYCTGCWGCWVKMPGLCVANDDTHEVRREYINSDFVLMVSPVIMGFTSALLKMTQDKLIPLVHPYITLVNNECHHEPRYPKYPLLGLLLNRNGDADAEDIEIISDIQKRFALNLKSELRFTMTMDQPVKEVCDAINPI